MNKLSVEFENIRSIWEDLRNLNTDNTNNFSVYTYNNINITTNNINNFDLNNTKDNTNIIENNLSLFIKTEVIQETHEEFNNINKHTINYTNNNNYNNFHSGNKNTEMSKFTNITNISKISSNKYRRKRKFYDLKLDKYNLKVKGQGIINSIRVRNDSFCLLDFEKLKNIKDFIINI